ncbi:(2Fe-2S)-binding protein [Methylobacterium terricola]|uniref:(2Fe-2S)-binding protein n=1 Tax=Methylobacterium terricola TaxID=2583531 RepID=A0A5C4L5I6_9HYPH|nr:2Fe-2S iron-sulfur cluster-binding protein [Methylobacterium terricola]TNC04913.1 (2Fe-2S)-binding protein [Methylobacterium terricola]
MATITWKPEGHPDIVAEVCDGRTLMEAALTHSVPGIFGDCGGALACATCHVVVAEEWLAATGRPGPDEDEVLDMVEAGRRPNSRLSCQIRAHSDLDGLILHVPVSLP